MRAIVHHRYGSPDVLRLEEVDMPEMADEEVLVEVLASSANAGDWHIMRADPFLIRLAYGGLLKPKHKILGGDIAGRVKAVGGKVEQFRPGDEVFGDLSECGFGAFAEYVSAPQHAFVLKPSGASFEEAAAVPGAALAALQGLRDKGKIQAGAEVLVNGASGGVGTFAVQIAKSFGAKVTGVCSTNNLEMVRSIGADQVIDYTREDFTQNGLLYDLILDAAAYRSILDYRRALSPHGIYVMVGGSTDAFFQTLLVGPWISLFGKKKMTFLTTKPNPEDLGFLKTLMESAKIAPVIDRRYKLSEVPEAIRYLEEKHARGKVVIVA